MDKTQRNTDLREYYKAGNTLADCEAKFDLKRQRVKQILSAAGLWEPRVKSERNKFVGIVVTEGTKDKLTKHAKAKGMSVSQMTSDALDALVRETMNIFNRPGTEQRVDSNRDAQLSGLKPAEPLAAMKSEQHPSVYIAAPYAKRDDAILLSGFLEAEGIIITSSWLHGNDDLSDESAKKCLSDVDDADVLVAYNPIAWVTLGGGRHVEVGYAIAKGKRVILFGVRTNIFHYLLDIVVVPVPHYSALAEAIRKSNS